MSNNVGEWSLLDSLEGVDMQQAKERIEKMAAAADVKVHVDVFDNGPVDGSLILDDELVVSPAGDGLWMLELATHHPGNAYRIPETHYEHIAGPARLDSIVVHALSKLIMMRVSDLLENEQSERIERELQAAQRRNS